ncbi:MAG: type II secretion system protein [Armatimonadota bacterium]
MKTPEMPRHRRARAFSLIEVLVAVMLLAISTASLIRLWGLSRTLTERNRDWSEYYSVARQEIERDKSQQFKALYITTGTAVASRTSDYDEKGALLATNLATGAAATTNAYYRAVSTYTLVTTGSETDATRRLGVQTVRVYRKIGTTLDTATVVYQVTDFYSAAGV